MKIETRALLPVHIIMVYEYVHLCKAVQAIASYKNVPNKNECMKLYSGITFEILYGMLRHRRNLNSLQSRAVLLSPFSFQIKIVSFMP